MGLGARHYIVYGGYAPVMRVSTGLNDRAALTALEVMGLDVLVRESVEVVDVYGEWGLVVVRMGEGEYRRLLSMGIKAEPEREYRLVGTGAGLPWNLAMIGWSRDMPYTGRGVTIAVVDSGVDPGACGLGGRLSTRKASCRERDRRISTATAPRWRMWPPALTISTGGWRGTPRWPA
jgi:subtilisin family serine protease